MRWFEAREVIYLEEILEKKNQAQASDWWLQVIVTGPQWWLVNIGSGPITWSNVDTVLCQNIVSLCHNALIVIHVCVHTCVCGRTCINTGNGAEFTSSSLMMTLMRHWCDSFGVNTLSYRWRKFPWPWDRCIIDSWWRHPMETFSALLALCAGNDSIFVVWVRLDVQVDPEDNHTLAIFQKMCMSASAPRAPFWNYLSIPKLQRCNRWRLGMDK